MPHHPNCNNVFRAVKKHRDTHATAVSQKALLKHSIYFPASLFAERRCVCISGYIVQALHQLGGGRRGGARRRPVQGIQGGKASGIRKKMQYRNYFYFFGIVTGHKDLKICKVFCLTRIYNRACKSRANNINNNADNNRISV